MKTQRKEALRLKIQEIMKISTVPSVLKRILEVTDDPRSGVSDLEKVIEHDQAIAARVVAVSNAVFYGFPRKISSITQAILVLGFEMVKGLAISTTVFNSVQTRDRSSLVALWTHSFETAMASVLIAQKTGLVNKESAFLAGLLHDIGRPIIFQTCGHEYLELCAFDRNCLTKEEEVFGASHAEAGAWFADKCKLPEDCVKAIRHHHSPEACMEGNTPLPPLVAIVYLANLIVSEAREPYALVSPEAHSRILGQLKLTPQELELFAQEISALRGAISSYYC